MQGQSFTKIKGPNYGLNVVPTLPGKHPDVSKTVAQTKAKSKLKPKQMNFGGAN